MIFVALIDVAISVREIAYRKKVSVVVIERKGKK